MGHDVLIAFLAWFLVTVILVIAISEFQDAKRLRKANAELKRRLSTLAGDYESLLEDSVEVSTELAIVKGLIRTELTAGNKWVAVTHIARMLRMDNADSTE